MGEGCQKCVKIFVLGASGIILCCGLALLIVTFTAINMDYIPSDDFHDWMDTFKLVLLILSLILMEIGTLGIFSAWKQNRCVIFLFQIQITFFSLIFLGVGIIALAIYQNVVKDINCSNLDVLGDTNTVITKSTNLMCSVTCPCNCENPQIQALMQTRGQTNFIASGVVRVQDCPTFEQVVGSYDIITKALKKVEEKFDCSGLCTLNQIYLFSDINRGQPTNMCFQQIIDEMKKILNALAIIGITVGLIKFITVWVACFLCCKARKRAKIQDDYDQVGKGQEMTSTPQQQQYY